MEIIPAIDIIDGKCVRLTQGDYLQKKEYSDSPLLMARRFEDVGIKRLHLVDLDGAKAKKIINREVLKTIAENTSLQIDFGGGVQSDVDIALAFQLGAKQVTGGSVAVKNPELFNSWISVHGGDKIILGADAKDRKIAISGWEETTQEDLIDFIKAYHAKGIQYVICTDVAKDGLLQGPSMELYRDILQEIPGIKLIASGGVASVSDLEELEKMGVFGTIVGKAYYEGRISLEELASFQKNN
ncbi:1-(5-phosphoribosyl)-5-[(5-phosphoribosylamino)methylideneamino] imidazole-4-carboxamide isomerase [Rhodonellum psychrophilum GCM71 = DSM 17998]|uniref:1-(5-phosphoribosyl)-5-[(5-phosphoribosylamino)methylideneamino] imidazole-4-carboxamide isomerase n=2 Tax=Rhodonellum TaxID=336827 RepID=U5C7M0_9BACT|nr:MULTISPECIES: 1-(5-phosphoribosyl)-5-[(5-phosphoribosylamino)methylideneamino]imidazole-4-carboxamide isomerase [Rhodonellum]ERM84207.1 1-(5-phosphoribosyl)-5-[(5-phosphoribosylamino)methylideneamino] imidazole-4-carboxamide isomerase [Rhodonellum psychrophilum GCM71 = DSM 17998]MDO9554132.1 1-(5-phosphoribosyl)-5-[(5-phosphoribosylamino)methylideneamino]imidazole-4-carboxamide isomerase [Rhodonellum sp.]SDZ19013.1 1-(5-phosphoribosyl)-5-[(5-phosphoribosylamino)methylideneamino] imidazole-4-c